MTLRRPKPLVPFGGSHSLQRAVAMLRAAGAEGVVVNAHHLAEQVQAWAAGEADVSVSVESTILGTAGGVAAASRLLGDGAVLVMNGDILADLDLKALQQASNDGSRPLAVLAVGPKRPIGEGTVGLSASGQIVRLRDYRGAAAEVASADFVGTQWIAAEARAGLPQVGCLVGDFYMPLLRSGRAIKTACICDGFFDVGTLSDYMAGHRSWLRERPFWCAEGAMVAAGVELVGSVVGAGARIEGSGRITRCVLWPGARAQAPLSDSIVMDDGTVVAVDAPGV